MPYLKIPPLKQWLIDTENVNEGTGLFQTICAFITRFHEAKLRGNGSHLVYLVYLYYATEYWLSKAGKVYRTGPNIGILRVPDHAKSRTPVEELRDCCARKIRKSFGLDESSLQQQLVDLLGRANPHRENELTQVNLLYMTSDLARIRYKVRFRKGLVWRSTTLPTDDQPPVFALYDSVASGESEKKDECVHYAMDKRGRLYLGYDVSEFKFFHSSLTGGETVISAGTMKVVNGVITVITNDSGHYLPKLKNLRDLLALLLLRDVDLSQITIQHYKSKETLAAIDVLHGKKWEVTQEF